MTFWSYRLCDQSCSTCSTTQAEPRAGRPLDGVPWGGAPGVPSSAGGKGVGESSSRVLLMQPCLRNMCAPPTNKSRATVLVCSTQQRANGSA